MQPSAPALALQPYPPTQGTLTVAAGATLDTLNQEPNPNPNLKRMDTLNQELDVHLSLASALALAPALPRALTLAVPHTFTCVCTSAPTTSPQNLIDCTPLPLPLTSL